VDTGFSCDRLSFVLLGCAESFFHTLKTEWVYHYRYATRAEARLSLFEYIEGFYNRTRKHPTLDYRLDFPA